MSLESSAAYQQRMHRAEPNRGLPRHATAGRRGTPRRSLRHLLWTPKLKPLLPLSTSQAQLYANNMFGGKVRPRAPPAAASDSPPAKRARHSDSPDRSDSAPGARAVDEVEPHHSASAACMSPAASPPREMSDRPELAATQPVHLVVSQLLAAMQEREDAALTVFRARFAEKACSPPASAAQHMSKAGDEGRASVPTCARPAAHTLQHDMSGAAGSSGLAAKLMEAVLPGQVGHQLAACGQPQALALQPQFGMAQQVRMEALPACGASTRRSLITPDLPPELWCEVGLWLHEGRDIKSLARVSKSTRTASFADPCFATAWVLKHSGPGTAIICAQRKFRSSLAHQHAVINRLLDMGHDVNGLAPIFCAKERLITPLMRAVRIDDVPTARLLLDSCADPNMRADRAVPICDAFSIAMVQLLLSYGADVNSHDDDGNSPLHAMAMSPHRCCQADLLRMMIKATLAAGGGIDCIGNHGLTPLQTLCRYRELRIDALRVLLDAGANASCVNDSGWTAASIARSAGREDAALIIEAHIAGVLGGALGPADGVQAEL